MSTTDSEKIVDASLEFLRANFAETSFEVNAPVLSDSRLSDVNVTEVRPSNPNASRLDLIAYCGSSSLDIEIGVAGRFSFVAGRRESPEHYLGRVIEVIKAVIEGGWTESIRHVDGSVTSSKIRIRSNGKNFRTSSRTGVISKPFQRVDRRSVDYAAW